MGSIGVQGQAEEPDVKVHGTLEALDDDRDVVQAIDLLLLEPCLAWDPADIHDVHEANVQVLRGACLMRRVKQVKSDPRMAWRSISRTAPFMPSPALPVNPGWSRYHDDCSTTAPT